MQKHLWCFPILATLVAFSGCGDKNNEAGSGSAFESFGENGGSYTGKYRYNVEGCDTGEHVFNSLAERCQMLADETLNHGCAQKIRLSTYQRSCGTRAAAVASAPGAGSGNGAESASGNLSEISAPTDVPVSFSPPRPSALTVLAKLTPNLEVKTSEVSGSVITTVNGSFHVASQGLPAKDIQLSYSSKVVFAELPEDCVLSVRNFEPIRRSDTLVRFTLVGIDSRATLTAGTGCAAALRRMARYGFQARFEQAYLVSPGSVGTSTVYLSVF
jgi:hypothetical protein